MTTKEEVCRERFERDQLDRLSRPAVLRRIKAVVEYYFARSPLELLTSDLTELDAMIAEAEVRER